MDLLYGELTTIAGPDVNTAQGGGTLECRDIATVKTILRERHFVPQFTDIIETLLPYAFCLVASLSSSLVCS